MLSPTTFVIKNRSGQSSDSVDQRAPKLKSGLGLIWTVAWLVAAELASANDGGVMGFSGNPATQGGNTCGLCHTGGVTPSLQLTGPTTADGGDQLSYELTISGGQATACGFNASATAGEIVLVEPDTRIFNDEVTHSEPRLVDQFDECRYAFDWIAPWEGGTVTLYAAGNSVDLSQTTAGDDYATSSLTVTVQAAPPGTIPPTADPGGPYVGSVGNSIAFDGSNSFDLDGNLDSYEWDWGDATSAGSGVSPSHAYSEVGNYTVTLTVTDDDGHTDDETVVVQVLLEPPSLQEILEIADPLLVNAVYATAPRFDDRLFIVKQTMDSDPTKGAIYILEDGALLATPFFTVGPINETPPEHGLRGLAFPPDYAETGLFYVLYSNLGNDTVIARVATSADPDRADDSSLEEVFNSGPLNDFHRGSHLEFGPDGYLYAAFGDGGIRSLAQDPSSFRSKMIRLDVSGGLGSGYSVPDDNPFVGPGLPLDEIWATGFRNPYRFDLDETGNIYVADVGQALMEEVSVAPSGESGMNFGWPILEGTSCFDGTAQECASTAYAPPIYAYTHEGANGCSIIGGELYRGEVPELRGRFWFGDWCAPRIFSLVWDGEESISDLVEHTAELGGGVIHSISAISADGHNELVILNVLDGELYRVIPNPAPCADGIDNDQDGDTDLNDVGCRSALDPGEKDARFPCDDGVDNDDDGLTDYPADPECAAPSTASEACSDGILDPGEQCDDGNLQAGDGCSELCQIEVEDSWQFFGSPTTGNVSFSVDGVAFQVPTLEGESVEEVASNVADAINDDPTLSQAGIFAFAIGGTVITNGTITDRMINGAVIPSLSGWSLGLLAALLPATAMLSSAWRRRLRPR